MYSSMCLILFVVVVIAVLCSRVMHMWCYSCMHHVWFFPPTVLFYLCGFCSVEVFSLGADLGSAVSKI